MLPVEDKTLIPKKENMSITRSIMINTSLLKNQLPGGGGDLFISNC